MPRQPRVDLADNIYHIINRANARNQIFNSDKDYQLFESLLEEAKELVDMRILSYTVMPNHWHLVLYPKKDGDLSVYMQWLTNAHTRKYHVAHKSVGNGHLYQGRYKSFIVQTNNYALRLLRYVEQNPLKAQLVLKAEDWRWGSLWRRQCGSVKQKQLLSEWPIEIPKDYLKWVNTLDNSDSECIQEIIMKGKPYGNDVWTKRTIAQHGLEYTVRGPGRPKKY